MAVLENDQQVRCGKSSCLLRYSWPSRNDCSGRRPNSHKWPNVRGWFLADVIATVVLGVWDAWAWHRLHITGIIDTVSGNTDNICTSSDINCKSIFLGTEQN